MKGFLRPFSFSFPHSTPQFFSSCPQNAFPTSLFHTTTVAWKRRERPETIPRNQLGKHVYEHPDENDANDDPYISGEDGKLYVKRTFVPDKYTNLVSNPFGNLKTKSDRRQEKKVSSLKAIHERSRMKEARRSHLNTTSSEERRIEMGKRRVLRVSELVKDSISQTFIELRAKRGASRVPADITINKANVVIDDVELSNDLKRAKVFWSVWNNDVSDSEVEKVLSDKDYVKKFRVMVTAKISHLKFSPELSFHKFETPLKMAQMETVLNQMEEKELSPLEIQRRRREDEYQKQRQLINQRLMEVARMRRSGPLVKVQPKETKEAKENKIAITKEGKIKWDIKSNSQSLADEKRLEAELNRIKRKVQMEIGPVKRVPPKKKDDQPTKQT